MTEVSLKSVKIDGVDSTDGEITALSFDVRVLRLTIECRPSSDWVYIEFHFPRGFRVLDEGDLLEFWRPPYVNESCLYEVGGGGWLDAEMERSGFVSTQPDAVKEYLVTGVDFCVNVLAIEPPKITVCR